jgi:adenosylhomocysteine nucleosidase
MLALLGAFGQEIADLKRQMVIRESVAEQHFTLFCGTFQNRNILVAKTGMGKERAESATRYILKHYPVNKIISLGFAGGLAPELMIGDVVVCSTLCCDSQEEVYTSDAHLLSLASKVKENIEIRSFIGSSVTALYLNASPHKMREVRDIFHTHIVDNESYWIVRIASSNKIPFIAVRAISDDIEHGIQPFDQILKAGGELLWEKAFFSFISHPDYLMNVFKLFSNTRFARGNMFTFLSNLVNKM